jgi:uncharacterized protein (DUF2249 family)
MQGQMKAKTVTLDVREDIRNGREPFSRIMNAVASLKADEELLLVAPFEPVPLFGVLKQQGFEHQAHRSASGDWEVRFTRTAGGVEADQRKPLPEKPACAKRPGPAADGVASARIEVDARGLEPPQPLVKILEALASLPSGAELLARTDRRPMHLYSQLEDCGFTGVSEEQSDGSFVTYIRQR